MKNTLKSIYISVVVPCFKEEKYIAKTLFNIGSVLRGFNKDYEIICVVDGIVDNTFKIASELAKVSQGKIKVVAYRENKGKGFAVRLGFDRAKGKIIGFIDADGQIEPGVLKIAVDKLESESADIVIGSKKHPQSQINYPFFRKLISLSSQIFIKLLFGINVSDTQAGVKIFRRNIVKEINPRLIVDRFAFDIEMLSVAKRMGYEDIKEIPIRVKFLDEELGSSDYILFIKDVLRTFIECLIIFFRLKILRYYDNDNKENWKTVKYPELLKNK